MLCSFESLCQANHPKSNEELRLSLKRLGIAPSYADVALFSRFRSPLGGEGLRATEHIPSGTPIISEEALFSIVKDRRVNPVQAGSRQFQALSCPFQPATPDNRFRANSFGMGSSRSGKEMQGIFVRSSRSNHSCVPNAYYAWNEKIKRLTVHAIVDIPNGEEIFVNYRKDDYLHTRAERVQALSADYNFHCTCLACTPNTQDGRESEERRRRMRDLQHNINRDRNTTVADKKLQLLAHIKFFIVLLRQEGLLYPQLADMYEEEVKWYTREMGSTGPENSLYKRRCLGEALDAARRKLDLDVTCNGHAAPEVAKTLKLISDLRAP